MDEQFDKLSAIELKVMQEMDFLFETGTSEREQVLAELKQNPQANPLLAKQYHTKCSRVVLRLESLLLELDKVDTLGGMIEIRSKRKELITTIQSLLNEADQLEKDAQSVVELQHQILTQEENLKASNL